MRRFLFATSLVALLFGALAATLLWRGSPELSLRHGVNLIAGSPHQRYAARLQLQRALSAVPGAGVVLHATHLSLPSPADVDAWLLAADHALMQAPLVSPPFMDAGTFTKPGDAVAWRLPARRGHRIVVISSLSHGDLFVDLFALATADVEPADGGVRGSEFRQLTSAASGATDFTYDVTQDEELVLRVQPPIGSSGEYRIEQRSEPSMTFPVKGLGPRSVQSQFGAQRDAGRRLHEGIDIFAPRGTPVVAATAGWVGSAVTNRLGGNVIWVWNPVGGFSTYYAHLDRRAATPGQRVMAGDVVGYIGNTGNARGGPPHLHFGVYAAGSGSVDPLPFVCGSGCDHSR